MNIGPVKLQQEINRVAAIRDKLPAGYRADAADALIAKSVEVVKGTDRKAMYAVYSQLLEWK